MWHFLVPRIENSLDSNRFTSMDDQCHRKVVKELNELLLSSER